MYVFDGLLHVCPIALPVDFRRGQFHTRAATEVHYDTLEACLGRRFNHGVQVNILVATTEPGKATEDRAVGVFPRNPALMIYDPIQRDGAAITQAKHLSFILDREKEGEIDFANHREHCLHVAIQSQSVWHIGHSLDFRILHQPTHQRARLVVVQFQRILLEECDDSEAHEKCEE